MRRRVLYDGTSRAAAAAVPLLADRFETAVLEPEALAGAAAPTVILVGEDSRLPPPESRHVRVVGLVDAPAPGPWPGHWYAPVPEGPESVAGHVALTGQILNLADAYAPPSAAPFTINRSFDEEDGYRTKSMLVVPMRTPQGETIGALQLINCKPDGALVLRSPEETERVVRPFDARHEKLAGSLASQAAVALANSRLYEAIRQLFEGFVQASVTAIESRDPSTSGHAFRVANLTVGLASVVDRASAGAFGGA